MSRSAFDNTLSGGKNLTPYTIGRALRSHPKSKTLINKVMKLALQIDDEDPHPNAVVCMKTIMGKILPDLKAIEIGLDDDIDMGVIMMPVKKKVGAPVEIDADYEVTIPKTVADAAKKSGGNGKGKKKLTRDKLSDAKAKKKLKKGLTDPARS